MMHHLEEKRIALLGLTPSKNQGRFRLIRVCNSDYLTPLEWLQLLIVPFRIISFRNYDDPR